MFENIIAQPATDRLRQDIVSGSFPRSVLFFGPPASGKGSSALELARVLSCEGEGPAPWNCPCPACARHRLLLHPDLAVIGPRDFAAEIAAARRAFLKDTASPAGRALFLRSLRKLLLRFSVSVWEYEARSGRANPLPLLEGLEQGLAAFEAALEKPGADLEKLSAALAGDAFKLEDECVGESVPIAAIRQAASWARLSPYGRRKTLVIENADRMKEDARNALLKLLEEPPPSIHIVLSSVRKESLMQTILSRLRPYRFDMRGVEHEREIIRRVFRDVGAGAADGEGTESEERTGGRRDSGLVAAYLDSFTPEPEEKLLPLAAFFVAAVTRNAVVALRRKGTAELSPALVCLGGFCARIAENGGLEKTEQAGPTVAALTEKTAGFRGRSFGRFLSLCLDLVS
ncbi:MAG: DNA polymerase III, partial [Treponema sp.]|nr:DNA polymerase III [Treponema sp.]